MTLHNNGWIPMLYERLLIRGFISFDFVKLMKRLDKLEHAATLDTNNEKKQLVASKHEQFDKPKQTYDSDKIEEKDHTLELFIKVQCSCKFHSITMSTSVTLGNAG